MTISSSRRIFYELAHKAGQVLREEGLASFVRRTFGRILRRPLFRWQFVIALDITQEMGTPAPKIPVHFEELNPRDFDQVVALHQSRGVSAAQLQARLDAGERCFVVQSGDQVLSLFWAQFGTAYSERLDRHYTLAPDEIYVYDSYTDPAHRGQGLSTAAPALAAQPFVERGYHWLVAFIVPANHAARRAVKKRTFRAVGYTGFVELFGIRWYFHRSRDVLQELDRGCYFRKV